MLAFLTTTQCIYSLPFILMEDLYAKGSDYPGDNSDNDDP